MVIVVFAGFVFTGVVTTLLGPALPMLSSQWSLTDAEAGRLFTAQFAGSILGVLLTSWFLPKYGHRPALIASYLMMAMGVGTLGLGVKVLAMPAVFACGVGQGVSIPTSNLLISDRNCHRRASALNLLNLAWGAGAVACPFFVGMTNRADNLRDWLLALAALLGIISVSAAMVHSRPQAPENNLASTARPGTSKKSLLVVGIMFFLYVGTEAALGGWVATYANRVDTSSTHMWVVAPSVFWGALLLGRALAPIFLLWLAENSLIILDLLFATAGVGILLSANSMIGILVGSGIAGVALSSVFPMCIARLSSFGLGASRAAPSMFALAGLGGAVLPWLVGWVATRRGSLRVALVLLLPTLLVMLALQTWDIRRVKCEPS